jgi:hypothetical protein
MQIELKPTIAGIVQAQVAAGDFPSVEDAVAAAVLGLSADPDRSLSDLSWTKPYVDAGLASLERGEGVPHEQLWEQLDAQLRSIT